MIARVCSCVAIAASAFTSSFAAAATPIETIGPFEIIAVPSTATVTGTFGSPISPTATPVSTTDALTGTPLIEDGLLNLDLGTEVELNFASPIFNTPGADFVVFQADFNLDIDFSSAGGLDVATDFDGFANDLRLAANQPSFTTPGAFAPTGVFLDVFFLSAAGTPIEAQVEVGGAPVDLSNLGVPIGASVSAIRLTSFDTSDPDILGVGVLPIPEPATFALACLTIAGVAVRRRR